MATHPVLGTWSVAFEPAQPAQLFLLITFHADGSMVWSHPFGGIGIGVWTTTGDRTVDSMTRFQNIADTADARAGQPAARWVHVGLGDEPLVRHREVVDIGGVEAEVTHRG